MLYCGRVSVKLIFAWCLSHGQDSFTHSSPSSAFFAGTTGMRSLAFKNAAKKDTLRPFSSMLLHVYFEGANVHYGPRRFCSCRITRGPFTPLWVNKVLIHDQGDLRVRVATAYLLMTQGRQHIPCVCDLGKIKTASKTCLSTPETNWKLSDRGDEVAAVFVHVLNKPKGFTQRLQFYQESCMCLDFLLKCSTCRVCGGEFRLFFFFLSSLFS